MGLFDKIKDNAKTISMKAIESTREYDEDYLADQPKLSTEPPMATPVIEPTAELIEVPAAEPAVTETTEDKEKSSEDKSAKEEAKDEAEDKKQEKSETKESTRRSKVIEVSKTEYEESKKQKEKEAESKKSKQAAKERLAKDYTPSYKAKTEPKKQDKKPSQQVTVGFADVTPGKILDPTKQAIYARERAALSALASRRKLDGSAPLYVASHMNFKTRVFVNRIEYSGSFGKTSLPMDQVAWIKLRSGGTGVIIETVEGKRLVMVVKQADRLGFAEAVLKVQSMQPKKGKFKDTKTVRIDELEKFSEGVDEIEKLAKLYDKGILNQEEFDAKKRQILGL